VFVVADAASRELDKVTLLPLVAPVVNTTSVSDVVAPLMIAVAPVLFCNVPKATLSVAVASSRSAIACVDVFTIVVAPLTALSIVAVPAAVVVAVNVVFASVDAAVAAVVLFWFADPTVSPATVTAPAT
jgi:hypothetical protein